ncbi:MAG: lysostaphin resistance A-like protein [Hyphomicrobium sp.]
MPDYQWRHLALALAALAFVIGLATFVGGVAAQNYDLWSGVETPGAWAPGELDAMGTTRLAVFLLAFQFAALAGTAAAIGAFRRPGVSLAPFAMPEQGFAMIAGHALALVSLAALYGFAVYVFDSDAIANDVRPFAAMIQSNAWPLLALAAVVGAPITEELAFRGFAYGVIAASPAGPRAAAVATAAMWAALHASYSIYGLVAIFGIGLYLAWLRQATGSLVPSIVCHGLYNGLIVAVLALAPDGALDAAVARI